MKLYKTGFLKCHKLLDRYSIQIQLMLQEKFSILSGHLRIFNNTHK